MVKVLENRVVDLDILPGTKEQQLMAQAQTQVDAAGSVNFFLNIMSLVS